MKVVRKVLHLFLPILFFTSVGCEQQTSPPTSQVKTNNALNALSVCINYAPVKIDILPLTEFNNSGDTGQASINIYISLLDAFGSQIKSPGVFRFELYEYVQRSAQPKGKRVILWPDVDLTNPSQNDGYWRDFLRAYEFNLPFEQTDSQSYILQATCLCPNGRRLSSELTLKYTK